MDPVASVRRVEQHARILRVVPKALNQAVNLSLNLIVLYGETLDINDVSQE